MVDLAVVESDDEQFNATPVLGQFEPDPGETVVTSETVSVEDVVRSSGGDEVKHSQQSLLERPQQQTYAAASPSPADPSVSTSFPHLPSEPNAPATPPQDPMQ